MTTHRYTDILNHPLLVRTLQPWYTNELKRLIKTPKLYFFDCGLLAELKNLSAARLQSDRTAFGPLLETFVLGELLKLASWSIDRLEFFHFRDRYDNEVDMIMEDQRGQVSEWTSKQQQPFHEMTSPVCANSPRPAQTLHFGTDPMPSCLSMKGYLPLPYRAFGCKI